MTNCTDRCCTSIDRFLGDCSRVSAITSRLWLRSEKETRRRQPTAWSNISIMVGSFCWVGNDESARAQGWRFVDHFLTSHPSSITSTKKFPREFHFTVKSLKWNTKGIGPTFPSRSILPSNEVIQKLRKFKLDHLRFDWYRSPFCETHDSIQRARAMRRIRSRWA